MSQGQQVAAGMAAWASDQKVELSELETEFVETPPIPRQGQTWKARVFTEDDRACLITVKIIASQQVPTRNLPGHSTKAMLCQCGKSVLRLPLGNFQEIVR